ncbi:DUF6048 family protein [Flavobacterium sp. LS1R49]|uniref:DUF6048 family protein n=1 Tax=Flavobacterium shii TaxID=2987687 RepID=A0A9X3C5C2_9FLAO|nr:DUF6048 family protein [Flavobacterium shii]MCV9926892.1 DUF6048 family protein [Flavobacterium shii]
MKHMSKYIFSFCFMLSLFLVQAQETQATKKATITNKTETEPAKAPKKATTAEVKKDSIPVKTDRYGVRFGVDLYKLTRGFYDKDYKGIEIVGDYRLSKKYYLAAEIGTEDKTTDDDRLNSTAKGSYIKAGFDYNLYQNWLDMENIISVGMRYGFSTFSQQLNTYKIYNANPYWGEVPPVVSGEKFSGLSASWLEVNAAVKAKVFNNIFIGFGVQLKTLISNKKPDNFDNLYIPGFNRTYNGNFGIGFNYTVSYFIPIYKKKVIIPVEIKK